MDRPTDRQRERISRLNRDVSLSPRWGRLTINAEKQRDWWGGGVIPVFFVQGFDHFGQQTSIHNMMVGYSYNFDHLVRNVGFI